MDAANDAHLDRDIAAAQLAQARITQSKHQISSSIEMLIVARECIRVSRESMQRRVIGVPRGAQRTER